LRLNTQNRIIKALNVFLEFVGRENDEQIRKCPVYKRSDMIQVTALDVFEEDEIEKIQIALLGIRKESHDLFTVLARTGLRVNEALGLCFSFINEGHFKGKKLDKLHKQIMMYEDLGEYYGYICLESQPAVNKIRTDKRFKDRFGQTWEVGSVPRKPLKLRSKIAPENFRFVPVFDKFAWNTIATRWNIQQELFEKKSYGKDGRDYLLFEGISACMFYNDVQKAIEICKLRFRSPHKLRHTFLTWFYRHTDENRFLARKVAGHNEERSVQIYSHINAV
jgi:integrase